MRNSFVLLDAWTSPGPNRQTEKINRRRGNGFLLADGFNSHHWYYISGRTEKNNETETR